MMLKQPKRDTLRTYFKNQRTLSKQDLWEYYTRKAPIGTQEEETGFFWFLFELQQEGVLYQLSEDTYRLIGNTLLRYEPYLDTHFYRLNIDLSEIYRKYGIYYHCAWVSGWFNEFMVHQPIRDLTIVEVEKEAIDTIFHHLKGVGYKEVFAVLYKKDAQILSEKYIFEAEKPIIVTKMLSGSRLIRQHKNPEMLLKTAQYEGEQTLIALPRLEKLLVDLYFDDTLLLAYKGAEQDHIFRSAICKYELNFRTMFAYASRRSEKKADKLKEYLSINFQAEIQNTVI